VAHGPPCGTQLLPVNTASHPPSLLQSLSVTSHASVVFRSQAPCLNRSSFGRAKSVALQCGNHWGADVLKKPEERYQALVFSLPPPVKRFPHFSCFLFCVFWTSQCSSSLALNTGSYSSNPGHVSLLIFFTALKSTTISSNIVSNLLFKVGHYSIFARIGWGKLRRKSLSR
jgi:hypothetical protein